MLDDHALVSRETRPGALMRVNRARFPGVVPGMPATAAVALACQLCRTCAENESEEDVFNELGKVLRELSVASHHHDEFTDEPIRPAKPTECSLAAI